MDENLKAQPLSAVLPYHHGLTVAVCSHLERRQIARGERVNKRLVAAAAARRLGIDFHVSRAHEIAVLYRYAFEFGVSRVR